MKTDSASRLPKFQKLRKSYPQYKDSGVAWLGQVPDGWEVKRLKWLSNVTLSNVDKKTKENEREVELCNYVDVYYNEAITRKITFMRASASRSQIDRLSLESGDVLITKDSEIPDDIAVPALVPETLHGVVCGYHLAHIRPHQTKLSSKYLFRSLLANGIKDQFEFSANGITRFGISKYTIENALFLVPPLPEQTAIADYLDRKTAQIDAVIAKKKRLIALLREERTALISHAVTKGLNPDAPMKDSGVAWLRQVPDHWEVKRLKFSAMINPSKSEIKGLPRDLEVSFYPMESVGFGELYAGIRKTLEEIGGGFTYFRDDDILVAKITPSFENGKGAIATGLANGIGFGTTELHVIRPSINLNKRFLFYLTYSHEFRHPGTGMMDGTAGQKRVPNDFLYNYPNALPPLLEQTAIADYLDRKTAQIDTRIARIEKQIALLQEYRTALISAVVTGKVDVREDRLPKSRKLRKSPSSPVHMS